MEGRIQIRPMRMEDYDEVHALWMTIQGFGIRSLDDGREDYDFILNEKNITSFIGQA